MASAATKSWSNLPTSDSTNGNSGSQAGNAVSTALYSVQHDRSTGGAGPPIRDSDARVGVGIHMGQLSELDRLRAAIHDKEKAAGQGG